MNTLGLAYTGSVSDRSAWINLEQAPVSTNLLTTTSLQEMLAMVINGVSARAYLQSDCTARISNGVVSVDTGIWVWPSRLDLAYNITPTLGKVGERTTIVQDREFNLAIDFSRSVDLPFYCTELSWEWTNIPCFGKYGQKVDRPDLKVTNTSILTPGDVYSVIRVRCRAHGYAHPLTIDFPKSAAQSIFYKTQITVGDRASDASVHAVWENKGDIDSESLDIDLPTCAEQLLDSCPDETSISEKVFGSVSDDDDKKPVLYYNGCSGKAMVVRYE